MTWEPISKDVTMNRFPTALNKHISNDLRNVIIPLYRGIIIIILYKTYVRNVTPES